MSELTLTTEGRYAIVRELAAGGMATVFEAKANPGSSLERRVAIKRIHAHLGNEAAIRNMFLDEARIVSRIDHPNVCRILDFGDSPSGAFIVMELLSGRTLSEYLRAMARSRPSGVRFFRFVTTLVAEAAEGLHAAHQACDRDGRPLEIVHRDISPSNLFLTDSGQLKVLDFGIAKARDRVHTSSVGEVKGKFAYMAPEQYRGQVDPRTDVWALGVVYYELLTLKPLFRRGTLPETVSAVQSARLAPPESLRPELAEFPPTPVLRALSRDSAGRPASAQALADELYRTLADVGGAMSRRELREYAAELLAQPSPESEERGAAPAPAAGESSATVSTPAPPAATRRAPGPTAVVRAAPGPTAVASPPAPGPTVVATAPATGATVVATARPSPSPDAPKSGRAADGRPMTAARPARARRAPTDDEVVQPDRALRRRRWVNASLVLVVGLFLALTSPASCSGVGGFTTYERGRSGPGPTVVLLHGMGAPGDDLTLLAEQLLAEPGLHDVRFLALEAPTRTPLGLAWYFEDEERSAIVDRLGEALRELQAEGTSSNELILAGFSQGGEVAAAVSAAHGPFGGSALLSAPIPPLAPEQAMRIAPVFFSHGRTDDLASFREAKALADQIEAGGATVTFVEFDGGHQIAPVARTGLAQWLRERLQTMNGGLDDVPPR